jgi:gamma-tubulin complex component 2
VPNFLEGWKLKILLAGKYLNVIRECGMEAKDMLAASDDGKMSSGLELKEKERIEKELEEGRLVAMNDERFVLRYHQNVWY